MIEFNLQYFKEEDVIMDISGVVALTVIISTLLTTFITQLFTYLTHNADLKNQQRKEKANEILRRKQLVIEYVASANQINTVVQYGNWIEIDKAKVKFVNACASLIPYLDIKNQQILTNQMLLIQTKDKNSIHNIVKEVNAFSTSFLAKVEIPNSYNQAN